MNKSNKSILIIDTPKNCTDCTFCEHLDEGWLYCSLKDKTARAFDRPDWCPLSLIPERKNLRQYVDNTALNIESMLAYQYAQGWNDCIDKLMEEKI